VSYIELLLTELPKAGFVGAAAAAVVGSVSVAAL
jgi:hypothetical protein